MGATVSFYAEWWNITKRKNPKERVGRVIRKQIIAELKKGVSYKVIAMDYDVSETFISQLKKEEGIK
jgi:hypothetical protein